MNRLSTHKFTAFIGIDWADSKHDVCLQAVDSQHREFDCFPHQVDRIEQWAHSIHQRFGGTIAIALELTKGPIVYALQMYDFFVLFRSWRWLDGDRISATRSGEPRIFFGPMMPRRS